MASFQDVLPDFDAGTVEPSGSFEPIPAGEYAVIITDSQMKPTKAGSGKFLELKMQIVSEEQKNRILFDRLNLINPNQQAVDIAKGTLSAICRAVGVMTPKDSAELHSKKLVAVVKVRKREDNGELSNEVKGYKRFGDDFVPTTAPSGEQTPW